MKALSDRSSVTANLLAPGTHKPINKPPPAPTESLKKSRRSIWRVLILHLPWTSCQQLGGSPCGSADRCHSGRCFQSWLDRCLHRSVVAFRGAGRPRSSVVRIDSTRTAVHLPPARHVARDGSGLATGPQWSLPLCPRLATLGPHRTVSLRRRAVLRSCKTEMIAQGPEQRS